jgi:hypothetical protein
MKYTKLSLLLLLLSYAPKIFGQTKQQIRIEVSYRDAPLQLAKQYALPQGDSIAFNMLRFYLSNITFYQNDSAVWKEKNSYHLINYLDNQAITLNFDVPENVKLNRLKCNLGIDSITNMAGAMGGDLDPTKGMYWAWQSGYINFKLEGKSSVCPTWKNKFQFHLGGYLEPYNALQNLDFNLKNTDNQIVIILNLSHFLENIDLKNQNTIMTPDENSLALAKKIKLCFYGKN